MFTRSLLLLTASLSFAAADASTGLEVSHVEAPHHNRTMEMAVWYPTDSDQATTTVGENGVFHGIDVIPDAPMASGKYPVVLMSHGLGGHYLSLDWLATGLVQRGAIVVSVNHPNSTVFDFDLRAGLDHWTRAQDLTVALAHLSSQAEMIAHLDLDRLYAAGFSYGGWTALTLGGIRGNLPGYVRHCEEAGTRSSHCNDIQDGGISLAELDSTRWGADYSDPRIKAVMALDPGLLFGIQQADTDQLVSDVTIITLGEGANRLHATDVSPTGSNFMGLGTGARFETVAPASHFTALRICKPDGPRILKLENDDPVCTDPDGSDRASVHQQVVDLTLQAFDL